MATLVIKNSDVQVTCLEFSISKESILVFYNEDDASFVGEVKINFDDWDDLVDFIKQQRKKYL